MKRSVFGVPRMSGGIKLNSFFIETSLIIPVFALCCCCILRLLCVAAERADNEQTYAAAVACAESWCELYGAAGSSEEAVRELFGSQVAEDCLSGMSINIPADKSIRYSPDEAHASVFITEKVEECTSEGLAYGLLLTSDIRIVWDNGEISERAVHYSPYPFVVPAGEEGEE